MNQNYLNNEDSGQFPWDPPAKELWEPNEPIPDEIRRMMPNEIGLMVFLSALKKSGLKDTPEARDSIRGFVNMRRKEEYERWKAGYYDHHPDELNVE